MHLPPQLNSFNININHSYASFPKLISNSHNEFSRYKVYQHHSNLDITCLSDEEKEKRHYATNFPALSNHPPLMKDNLKEDILSKGTFFDDNEFSSLHKNPIHYNKWFNSLSKSSSVNDSFSLICNSNKKNCSHDFTQRKLSVTQTDHSQAFFLRPECHSPNSLKECNVSKNTTYNEKSFSLISPCDSSLNQCSYNSTFHPNTVKHKKGSLSSSHSICTLNEKNLMDIKNDDPCYQNDLKCVSPICHDLSSSYKTKSHPVVNFLYPLRSSQNLQKSSPSQKDQQPQLHTSTCVSTSCDGSSSTSTTHHLTSHLPFSKKHCDIPSPTACNPISFPTFDNHSSSQQKNTALEYNNHERHPSVLKTLQTSSIKNTKMSSLQDLSCLNDFNLLSDRNDSKLCPLYTEKQNLYQFNSEQKEEKRSLTSLTNEPSYGQSSEKESGSVSFSTNKGNLSKISSNITSSVLITIRSVISEWKAGIIIGRQGSCISDLRHHYRCKITVSSNSIANERFLTVTGPWSRVACVLIKICVLLAHGACSQFQNDVKQLNDSSTTSFTSTNTLKESTLSNHSDEIAKQPCSSLTTYTMNHVIQNMEYFKESLLQCLIYPEIISKTILTCFENPSWNASGTSFFSFFLLLTLSQHDLLLGLRNSNRQYFQNKFSVTLRTTLTTHDKKNDCFLTITGTAQNTILCLVEMCRLLSLYPVISKQHDCNNKSLQKLTKDTSSSSCHVSFLPMYNTIMERSKSCQNDTLSKRNHKACETNEHFEQRKTFSDSLEKKNSSCTTPNSRRKKMDTLTDVIASKTTNNLEKASQMKVVQKTKKNKCDSPIITESFDDKRSFLSYKPCRSFNDSSLSTSSNGPNDPILTTDINYPFNLSSSFSDIVEETSISLPTGEIEVYFKVPNDIVGCIIGKGGKTISEIRNTSDTFISITETLPTQWKDSKKTIFKNNFPSCSGSQETNRALDVGTRQRNRIICIRGPKKNVLTARFLMGSSILSAQRSTESSFKSTILPNSSNFNRVISSRPCHVSKVSVNTTNNSR
jgi:hypothetical protein